MIQHRTVDCFFGPDVRAELVCDETRCRLEIAVSKSATNDNLPETVTAEVLWQSKDHTGLLPQGPPTLMLRQVVRMMVSFDGSCTRGTMPLPEQLDTAQLRQSYFRIRL